MAEHELMQSGDSLIYREREAAPSEPVRFLQRKEAKKPPRIEVEFMRGDRAGTRASVPGNRIYGPWSGVEAFDAYMAGLERLRADDETTETESGAVEDAYLLLLPRDVAGTLWNPVHHATRIHQRARLEELVATDLDALLQPFATMEQEGDLLVSPNASSAVAEALCRAHPAQVAEWVLEDEERRRAWTKRGKPAGVDGSRNGTSPEWEWLMYRQTYRPIYELLRSWCGHRAVTAHEQRVTAEAEVQRLKVLCAELIDSLREFRPHWPDAFDERLRRDRIKPETIRPLVERPLDPSEVQVRVEYRAGRRWGD